MESDLLTQEIARHILKNIGVLSASKINQGLISTEFKLNKTIPVEFEDGTKVNSALYSGKVVLQDFHAKALVIDYSSNEEIELGFFFKVQDQPIYGIVFNYEFPEDCLFKVYANNIWTNCSIHAKAMILAGFEQLTSLGVLWSKEELVDELLEASSKFLG